jgi:Acyl-CoA synthetases (AMP-forming)/AMP-acid ligases II
MGLIGQLLVPIVLGGTTVCMEPMTFLRRPHLWLRMIDDLDVEVSAAPSFAYGLCARRVTDAQLSGLDLSRWRMALNGSEPVSASIMAGFSARFAAAGFRAESLAPVYGLAESALLVSGSVRRIPVTRTPYGHPSPGRGDARPVVSCGRPSDTDVRIVDPDLRVVLTDGQIGEIWVRSDSVALGYWKAPRATESTFAGTASDGEHGFLRTGDLGFLREGELHVTGRIKEVVAIRGRKLHPHDLEEEIRRAHSPLSPGAGAAFSVPGGEDGEQLVLVHETVAGLPARSPPAPRPPARSPRSASTHPDARARTHPRLPRSSA